ncbi:thiol reductant ABC exporter subunit CydC [Occultella aeris]|uniref:Putative ABC transporter ATP-binding protein n=1 Tax=Occultella aeris TaxID=2761496 RepID=A0A7M4DN17_9MICO|nr:thiol reductant ABC exporter subunit CydC [Occultella aeris]VZO38827.1 putative ABC transporter ATP-binding protein [Occultella aeris]
MTSSTSTADTTPAPGITSPAGTSASRFPARRDRRDLTALRRILPLLRVDASRVLVAVVCGTIALGSAVGLAAASAWLIARASEMPPVMHLGVAVVAVRALGISRGVFRYLERLSSHEVALRGVVDLRTNVYRILALGHPEATAGMRRGDVLARVGADVDAVGDVVVRALVPTAVAVVVSAGTVGLVAAFSPAAAGILTLALLLAGIGAPALAAAAARRSELAGVQARADVAAASMLILDGATELRVSGRLAAAVADLRRAQVRVAATQDAAARPAALAQGLGVLATGLAVVGAMLVGIPATTAGTLAPVELAVVVLTPLAAFEAAAALPAAALQVIRSGGAARRLVDLLDRAGAWPTGGDDASVVAATPARASVAGDRTTTRASADAGATPTPASAPRASATARPASAVDPTVVATGLACGYPGHPPVLTGLDLRLEPGHAVVVVGPSGIGKTTLLLTLAGLLEPVAGEVRIGGTVGGEHASATVAVTAEDAHVFATTVLENLRVARGDVTPGQATEALTRAGLGDLLDRLPDGLDTMLGPDATTLSGGERRRLLLARALLHPAPLMLLDEPGEHLDPATADALIADILSVGRERGVLVVTHRLAGLDRADQVIDLGARDIGPSPKAPVNGHTGDMETLEAGRRP